MKWEDLIAYGIIFVLIVGGYLKTTKQTFPELVNRIIDFFNGLADKINEED